MPDERHTTHPITVEDKHSSFLAKARRLNRTKLFVVEDKAKLSENVKREEFKVLVKKELHGDEDERAVAELKDKFEKQQLRNRRQEESKGRLGTMERKEYGDIARKVGNRNEWKHATPLDRTVKDARKLMDSTTHYDDVKMMDRRTMDSRAAAVGTVYGENGELNIDDQMKSADFSSPLYMGYAKSTDAERMFQQRGNARDHLGQIGEALGFSEGEVINPSQMELRDTFDSVFGMSQEQAQQELLSPSLEPPPRQRYGHDQAAYKNESYNTDYDYYNALQPIPPNYTVDHMNKPKLKKHHNSDYDERQSIALAESVIKEVRKKYSVTAVRSMYRRRKESEQEDQRAAYNRNKKMMQAGKRAREWKKARFDDVKGRKTRTMQEVSLEEKKPPPKEESSDEEEDFSLMENLTLKEMSTDPFYKSNKEMDCRAQLRAKRRVLLRSNIIENGGYAADAKLCLQMLATTLLRDIDGGIIPRAKEVINEGTATGDWEMWLDPKIDKYSREAELKTFEVKVPRHNFDDVDRSRKNLTTAPM